MLTSHHSSFRPPHSSTYSPHHHRHHTMSSFSSLPPSLFSNLLFSFLLSLLLPLLLFFSSSPISFSSATAAVVHTSTSPPTTYNPFSSAPHQTCVHQHLSVLLQLKRTFNFTYSSSTNLSTWNANNPDCCSWEGITCNSFTGHVIGLNLSGFDITGLLNFQSLFQLGSLQRLDLSDNFFQGSPIPSGFGQLRNLPHLHLRWGNFYGQIPLEIFHLTRLVSLDLSYSYYYNVSNHTSAFLYLESSSSGMDQLFGNLSVLRELFLDSVNLSAMGNHWSRILSSALPNLQKLSLTECSLSGPLHPSLSRLHLLTLLDLGYNHLPSSVLEFVSNLTSLTSLGLSGCDFHHNFPTSIFNMPKLQSLDISWNPFLAIHFPKLSINSTIQELQL